MSMPVTHSPNPSEWASVLAIDSRSTAGVAPIIGTATLNPQRRGEKRSVTAFAELHRVTCKVVTPGPEFIFNTSPSRIIVKHSKCSKFIRRSRVYA